ncbi:MAG: NYN domain-containing protein [Chloroflexi bacterium]|nr:NYN domain-containing protein [Chloroflexota bacterium]
MRTNVYVDGFNLYYGAVKDTPYKWLDLAQLCRLLLPGNQINRIRYFTALVKSRPKDPGQQQRQQTYLRALQTIPNLSIHYGHFLSSRVRMPIANPPTKGPRTVEVVKTEEKGSDVNLASLMLVDGFRGDYEAAVMISNDSDLQLPIQIVRSDLALEVGVLNPEPPKRSWVLSKACGFYKPIRAGVLEASQFPSILRDAGGTITKPKTW